MTPPSPHRIALALAGLALAGGAAAWLFDRADLASLAWAAGIFPALALLAVEIVQSLRRGETGVDVLAALSMVGALLLGEHLAGVVIALMFTGGTVLEEIAGRRATRELRALLDRTPRIAHLERDGTLADVPIEAVHPGDVVLVKAGEVLPVDGLVVDSAAVLDEAALTGESLPVERPPGARVASGTLNVGAAFRLRAFATAADSTYAAIVRLVETAQSQRAPFARLADRWAMLFLPLSLGLAGFAWLLSGDPTRALAVLVVATPCPLILAVPVALVAGISAAARRGILVKGGGALESLARAGTLVFDKTGTLTTGRARLVAIESAGEVAAAELLRLAASLDQLSQHPIAEAVVAEARARGLALALPESVTEEPGIGIAGTVEGRPVRLGGLAWVADAAPPPPWAERLAGRAAGDGASGVFVALDGRLAGALLLADEIRSETPRALRALRAAGIRRIVMLSGDRQDVAEAIAAALGVDVVLAERSPREKVDAVRAESAAAPTVMVGDGVNDAPALAAADVGIAMGARGAGAASEAADVVLLVDRLDRVAEAITTARRSRRIALESVVAGIGLSGLGMIMAALGHLPPVAGALVQEAIDVAVILNALRAVGTRRGRRERGLLPAARVRQLVAEHRELLPLLDRLRALADRMQAGDGAGLVVELREVDRRLREQMLPHEQGDEVRLHPGLAPALGGRDPFAPISRTHREIGRLVRRFGRLVAELPADGPTPDDVPELRRILYGLEAILRLHFAQEDEIYESVASEGDGRATAGRA